MIAYLKHFADFEMGRYVAQYVYDNGKHYVEHPDGYFKPKGPGVARLKGKHVLAVLDLCRVMAMGKGGDLDSTPTVNLSAAWDTEEVFARL